MGTGTPVGSKHKSTHQDTVIAEQQPENKEYLAKVLAHSPLGAVVAYDGRVLYVNDKFTEISGYSLKDTSPLGRWFARAFPNRPLRKEIYAMWRAGFPAASGVDQYPTVCADGTQKYLQYHFSALDDGAVIINLLDNTTRKTAEKKLQRSEARFRNLVGHLPWTIFETDADFNLTFSNQSGFTMFQISARSFEQGINVTDLLHPYEHEQFKRNVCDRTQMGYSHVGNEYIALRADGTIFPIRAYSHPIIEEGNFCGLRGLVMDITEIKNTQSALDMLNNQLEEIVDSRTRELKIKATELELVNKRLTQLDRMKSAFLSSVSHELRTPMTSVLGFAKLSLKDFEKYFADTPGLTAQHSKKAERIKRNLDIIVQEGERLTRMINDVLDLTRIEDSRAEWLDTPICLSSTMREAVNAAQGMFQTIKEVDFIHEIEDLPMILADADRIKQVVLNLLGNAAKFTRKGKVRIQAFQKNDGSIHISVEDTGIGIPEQELGFIFNKFHQAAIGTKMDKPKGTGLGLAICKNIINHYQGRIWVESEQGKGSTFKIQLPSHIIIPDQP